MFHTFFFVLSCLSCFNSTPPYSSCHLVCYFVSYFTTLISRAVSRIYLYSLISQTPIPAAYPFIVPADSPVLRDLTVADIPGRNPLHPPIYRYDKPHPHHRVRPDTGITYVYLQDPSPDAKKVACAIEDKMKVPRGPIAGTYVMI